MTALSERIAAEHQARDVNGQRTCTCGVVAPQGVELICWHSEHIAAVTEREVRQQVAREIEGITIRGGNNRDKHASVIRSKAANIADGTDQ